MHKRSCFWKPFGSERVKDGILTDIKNRFEHEKENYYKTSNFWSFNYTEYDSKGGRTKTLSVEEYLTKIRPYLKDIINNLKKFDTWKAQTTIAINFLSSIDNYEECVMHSKSDNTEIVINDEANKVIKELFGPLRNRYQNNLELMKCSYFVFDYVH